MVAFPINWSLLLVSLCQTSTSRGTLQDAQIHTLIQTCLEPLPKTRLQKIFKQSYSAPFWIKMKMKTAIYNIVMKLHYFVVLLYAF